MDKNKTTFWDLPAWAKWDELHENSDDYLLGPALKDSLTEIEKSNQDYILYSEKGEALLFRPKKLIPRLGMELYFRMMQVFKHN